MSDVYLSIKCYIAAPDITEAPVNTNKLIGTNFTFNCTAVSLPHHGVQWQHNGDIINSSNRDKYSLSSRSSYLVFSSHWRSLYAYNNQLTITNLTYDDAGDYTCIVSNVHGTDNATATLQVQGM